MAQKRKRSRKWVYWVVFLVLAVAAGVVAFLVWDNYFRDKGETEDAGSGAVEERENIPGDLSDEAKAKVESMSGQEKSESVSYDSSVSGNITYQAIENGKFLLRIAIDQPVDSEGACRLSVVANGAEKYSNTVLMEANSTYYSCAFNVPLNDFAKGEYSFAVEMMTDSQSGKVKGNFVYE